MGQKKELHTDFAPPERADVEELKRQIKLIEERTFTKEFLDAIPMFVTVLNQYRQFVFVNKSFAEFLNVKDKNEILGLRPGEAVGCIHAYERDEGCGTTEFCRYCGAVNSILEAIKGISNEKECLITLQNHQVLDLLVWSSPMEIEREKFIIFTIMDIQHKKRRRALERIFFHDVLNTAGNLRGFVSLLNEAESQEEMKEYSFYISEVTEKLIEEIKSQKDLLAAENEELQIEFQYVAPNKIVEQVVKYFKGHGLVKGKELKVEKENAGLVLKTDPTLIRRVVTNMVKNALEASKEGDVITVGVKAENGKVIFYVHNPAFMPPSVQNQIFLRNFSTKGSNRGLGTYSMRLLTEKYLQGKVSFKSTEEDGTTFYVTLPLNIEG